MPSLHRDHFQITLDVTLGNQIACQFAQGQSVPHGQRVTPNKRTEARLQDIAFDRLAADGIGPVEHHDPDSVAGSGFHT